MSIRSLFLIRQKRHQRQLLVPPLPCCGSLGARQLTFPLRFLGFPGRHGGVEYLCYSGPEDFRLMRSDRLLNMYLKGEGLEARGIKREKDRSNILTESRLLVGLHGGMETSVYR